jgi:CRISPR-associated endoribonuclease Cas6
MRLMLKLKATKACAYDLKYFTKLQGFVYSLLKSSEYSFLHDKKQYKFFCFSNIYPVGDIKEGERRNLLISSPDEKFIDVLEGKLKSFIDEKKPINIGEYQFELQKIKKFKLKLKKKNVKLISATPIIIRIPEKNYEKYNIPEKFRKKRYVFWRPEYSFEAFIKQLEENLTKKYNEFYKTNIKPEPIFEMFKFIKPTVNHIIMEGKEQIVVGSIWEFWFSYLAEEQKKILEFGVDAGFGERNSLGFGFVNVIKE